MQKKEKNKYTKRISIRLKEDEYMRLEKAYKASVYRKLSEYARQLLLERTVKMTYRNKSTDDLLPVLTGIKKDLNGIGNNFNQAVHRLHTLDTIPDIKKWVIINEASKKMLLQKVEEMRIKLIQIYEACDRK